MTDHVKIEPTVIAADDWHAMQYVLGELSETDAAAFECLLAVDQDVRDRVVDAVRLVESIGHSRPNKVVNRSARPVWVVQRSRRIGIALAATILVVAGLFFFKSDEPALQVVDEAGSTPVDIESERLLALWTESGESFASSTESDVSDDGGLETSASLLPPDWMLAAVEQEVFSAPSFEDPLDGQDNSVQRN